MKLKNSNLSSLGLFCSVAILAIGCGSETVPTGGKVTVDGVAVTSGKITFYLSGDDARPGTGRIKEDGTYQISYHQVGDGLPPGDYDVTIVADEMVKTSNKSSQSEDEFSPDVSQQLKHIVPTKYNDRKTSPLKVTVTTTREPFDFDLSSED